MNHINTTIPAEFRKYAALQMRRHKLLCENETAASDEIEDEMDSIWDALDPEQRRNLNGFAADLNWIRRQSQPPPKGRKLDEVTTNDHRELLAAREAKDWFKFLHFLRMCAIALPPMNVGYLRGVTYHALGFPEYALAFYEYAADMAPSDHSMGIIALQYADAVDGKRAEKRAEKVISARHLYSPPVVAMSVLITLRKKEREGSSIDRTEFTAMFQEALESLTLEPPSAEIQAMTYQLTAAGFETLDELKLALQSYEAGLKLAPNHEVLLIGLGLMLYGVETKRAVELFQRVVEGKGTPLVWPYFFLAHYYVLQGNYDDSLRMVRLAKERATTNPIRAELSQWQAICLAENGYPPEVVRPVFQKAKTLDPTNERIARNLEAFETSQQEELATEWDFEDEIELRTGRAPRTIELEPAA